MCWCLFLSNLQCPLEQGTALSFQSMEQTLSRSSSIYLRSPSPQIFWHQSSTGHLDHSQHEGAFPLSFQDEGQHPIQDLWPGLGSIQSHFSDMHYQMRRLTGSKKLCPMSVGWITWFAPDSWYSASHSTRARFQFCIRVSVKYSEGDLSTRPSTHLGEPVDQSWRYWLVEDRQSYWWSNLFALRCRSEQWLSHLLWASQGQNGWLSQ